MKLTKFELIKIKCLITTKTILSAGPFNFIDTTLLFNQLGEQEKEYVIDEFRKGNLSTIKEVASKFIKADKNKGIIRGYIQLEVSNSGLFFDHTKFISPTNFSKGCTINLIDKKRYQFFPRGPEYAKKIDGSIDIKDFHGGWIQLERIDQDFIQNVIKNYLQKDTINIKYDYNNECLKSYIGLLKIKEVSEGDF